MSRSTAARTVKAVGNFSFFFGASGGASSGDGVAGVCGGTVVVVSAIAAIVAVAGGERHHPKRTIASATPHPRDRPAGVMPVGGAASHHRHMESRDSTPEPTAAPVKEHRQHRALVWILIVVATVIAFVAIATTWVDRQMLDNHAWKNASKSVAQDPAVRSSVATYLV